MRQLPLLGARKPPSLLGAGIDLRCCDVAELLADMQATGERAVLVVADPPWMYSAGVPGHGFMGDHYEGLSKEAIAAHVREVGDIVGEDAYLALWCTWPMLGQWMEHPVAPWGYKSGGSWHKLVKLGTGYHWRGQTEPLLLYTIGKPKPSATIRAGHETHNGVGALSMSHSEKPLGWAREHVRAFCPPGGIVLDLYAGMAPYARACLLEGRQYRGAEIDPERHAMALALLAQVRR